MARRWGSEVLDSEVLSTTLAGAGGPKAAFNALRNISPPHIFATCLANPRHAAAAGAMARRRGSEALDSEVLG